MYLPHHFEESRTDVLHALIRERPLGLLVTRDAQDGLASNLLPFLLAADRGPQGTLLGHVARANLVLGARTDIESMVVFQGPQAYVSPSWYASKQDTGKVVPTWNYVCVELKGRLRFIDDPRWVRALVTELTGVHEASQAAPWSVDDAPADYLDKMLHAIVGIELTITSLQGKWKVSQNRGLADREGVAAGLRSAPLADDDRRAMAALLDAFASKDTRP